MVECLTSRGAEGIHGRRVPQMFHIYVLFLILSGAAMLVMAAIKTGPRPARRILSAVLGTGFTIYGLYLLLFFHGGHYVFFFYVFVVPILMVIRFFRDRAAYQAQQQPVGFQAPPPPGYGQDSGYGQPSGYGQAPGYGQSYENRPPGQ